MKRILFIAVFWFFYKGVFAQTGNEPAVSPVEHKKFSAGISFTPFYIAFSYFPQYIGGKTFALSLSLPGINAEYSFNKQLSLQSGINFTGEMKPSEENSGPACYNCPHTFLEHYYVWYMEVPINLKIYLTDDPKRKPYISTGLNAGFIIYEKAMYSPGPPDVIVTKWRFNRITPTFAVGKERLSKSGKFSFSYSGVAIFPAIYNRKQGIRNFASFKVGMQLGMNYRF